ncbi:nucleotidyltransferase domain-containing protein [Roseospira navarrensis]|uniref:Polymerase nucleotidyl transferase domain-containing protein n=1 Tax=Roseospira navarrensis TaxID=140058 RepID=A0A7X1ZF51_9PROT|nr:nucleotidyltransferase domain-containing protein [Roseospira navarrensis]MQX36257.1 hypothetical protein [Roseospira navarrensis]
MTRAPALQHARERVRDGLIAALRAACAAAVRDPARIEAVMLVGSVARGDFDGLSDADIVVIGAREAFESGVFADIDRPVDVLVVPPAQWHGAGEADADAGMVADLRADAVPLWP